ncbi:DUF1285 domain-containing protein [Pseudoalteromonas sp. CO325X]|uniref:DUF1285 domain-containing protein n=1 Tax=Pseudoalteromonas sp. CO325X TaxID=1777262 RepID=UPI001023AE7B|nr:DUF1285 domain-containing protein [Pseudoalteromonas sp. CO325X]RZF79066.1 DUF1285 domain-containing protein [Pseudoalteromonas sp. CO325X]
MSSNEQALAALSQQLEGQIAPLDQWSPQQCGTIDIHITADGRWFHHGTEIKRARLVKLFASVLWREQGQYYLKTPVEQMAIRVDDAPLLIVDWRLATAQNAAHPAVICIDNIGREFVLGAQHPLLIHADPKGQKLPYLQLPYGVQAKLARTVYYAWAEQLAQPQGEEFIIYSAGESFSLGG